jgi:hypothetical protein
VGVRTEGQADLRVPEDLHGHPSRHTLLQQKRCRRVPGVVQSSVAHAGRREQRLP